MALRGMRRVRAALALLETEKNNQVKAIMFQGLGAIQAGTPVDEGFARNNWYVSVGSPSFSFDPNKDAGGELLFTALPQNILNQNIYYTNSTPYIIPLEYDGHSDQARFGWVRAEMMRMAIALRRI